jgi:hypothetical protein
LLLLAGSLGILCLLCINQPALARNIAQAAASLSGTVIDETGAVVSGVQVTVINEETGIRRGAETNKIGYFFLPLLPPGNYTLSAEMPGFATVTVGDVLVEASLNASIQIILKPQKLNEKIDVVADSSVDSAWSRANPTDPTRGYAIGSKQAVSAPILTGDFGRNSLSVLPFLVPGVSPTSVFGSGRSDTNRFGNQMSISGGRPTSISFYLDGADNNDDARDQAASPFPNPDALRELSVIPANYQADMGRSSGGILNAVVKSGGNDFNGNLRYFLINEALNARGFFDPRVPLDRLNTFGGQAGGPVVIPWVFNGRGRTLFFVDYERTLSGRESLSRFTVPSAAERIGDFSNSSPTPIDPSFRRRFPDDVIPTDVINPIARQYLDRFIPLPNSGENDFTSLLLTTFKTDQVAARVDSTLGPKDSMSATFLLTALFVSSARSTLPLGSRNETQSRNQNLIVSETHVFAPQVINQLTAGVTFFTNDLANISPGATGVSPGDLGFTGIRPQNGRFLGVPSVFVAGTGLTVITGGDSKTSRVGWHVRDDLSWINRGHALKFGGESRGFLQSSVEGSNNGSFTFRGNFGISSTNPIADFMLGIPFSYTQTTGNTRYPRQRGFGVYALDEWRPRPNFALNLGLRYEVVPPVNDKMDQVNAFRPGHRSRRFPHAPIGLLFAVDPDPVLGRVPRGLYATDKNNLAPRLGLAYSPQPVESVLDWLAGNGKAVLRAGFGVFYDNTAGIALARVSSTQPYSISQTLPSAVIRENGGTFANPFGRAGTPWPLDLNRRDFHGIPNLQVIDPHFRTPYVFHYNVRIQRELAGSLYFEAAYVGSQSSKLARQREINEASLTPDATPTNVQLRRRNPLLASVMQQESSARARYDSLQVRVNRKVARGLLVDASYVYGRSLDNASEPLAGVSTDPTRWGRSSYDRKHSFVASYAYELPKLGAGWAAAVLEGWQLYGITECRSGLPLDIAQGFDSSLTGRWPLGNPDLSKPVAKFDPRKPREVVFQGIARTGNYFFDPASFKTVNAAGLNARAGNLGRNVVDGPGLAVWSLSIAKRFPLAGSHKLALRADIRNLFNRANFQPPETLLDDATSFGKVSLAGPGRNVQLSLKYFF